MPANKGHAHTIHQPPRYLFLAISESHLRRPSDDAEGALKILLLAVCYLLGHHDIPPEHHKSHGSLRVFGVPGELGGPDIHTFCLYLSTRNIQRHLLLQE